MARTWRLEVEISPGVVHEHYVHDDGTVEIDPNTGPVKPYEFSQLVGRLVDAVAQYERLGWMKGELKKL